MNKTYYTTTLNNGAGFVVGAYDRNFSLSFTSNGNYYIENLQVYAWLNTPTGAAPITTMQRATVSFNINTANFNTAVASANSTFNIMPGTGYINIPFYNLISARTTITFSVTIFTNQAAIAGDLANSTVSINYYTID